VPGSGVGDRLFHPAQNPRGREVLGQRRDKVIAILDVAKGDVKKAPLLQR
jgi:hypothetical protein